MKIFKFYLLLILTGAFIINSCYQEEKQVQPSDNLTDQIGYWHNIAVGSLFDNPAFTNYVEAGEISYSEIRDRIMKELSRKDVQLFHYESIREDLLWSDRVLSEKRILLSPFSGNKRVQGEMPIDFAAVFRYLYDTDEIGETLYNSFIDLNKKVLSFEVSREEIIKLSRQIGGLPLSTKEKSYVDVFNQVLYYSDNYWSKNHARIQDKRTLSIIWADAAGGLYGMLCGPVCSIIEAAMFSSIMAIQE